MTEFEDRARCYKTGVQLGNVVEDLGQLVEDATEDSDFARVIGSTSEEGYPTTYPLEELIVERIQAIDQLLVGASECGVTAPQTWAAWQKLKADLKKPEFIGPSAGIDNGRKLSENFTEFNRHLAKME